jgi:glycosyltransferase involved in cell wall biosynthesis
LQRDSETKGGEVADPLVASASPLVSCIIIFLNEEKFLADAVESVLAQTYANWELLLVDDGSADASESIAMAYCARHHERIRYLTHEGRANRGMSASRNLGLQEARGEITAFLDADDSWLPQKLEQQIALFEEHPEAVMVCGATLYWHSWHENSAQDEVISTGDVRRDGKWVRSLKQDHLYPSGELLRRLYPLGEGMTPSSSGNMFRRDTALAVAGYVESFRGLFEDQVFRAKMYLAGPIYVSSTCFDRYRQHGESTSQLARASGQSRALRRRFLRWLKHYLDEVGYRDADIRWKLRKALLRSDYPRTYRLAARIARRVRSALRQS